MILRIDGKSFPTLSGLRARLAEAFGTTVTAEVRRGEQSQTLQWTLEPGTYRFSDWPGPAELFLRRHAARHSEPGIQAAARAIEASSAGLARSAARHHAAAVEAGIQDPLLDWAQAWLCIRHIDQGKMGLQALARAEAPAPDRAPLPLCRLATGWYQLRYQESASKALAEARLARDGGVDVVELLKAASAILPPTSAEARSARLQAFQDDPLDAALAEDLARTAGDPAERERFVLLAGRLRGSAPDPRLHLAALVQRVGRGEADHDELIAALKEAPALTYRERADAFDSLADASERERGPAAALPERIQAFRLWPGVGRARWMEKTSRAAGVYSPALRALGQVLRTQDNPSIRTAYAAIHSSLESSALVTEGLPFLEEALRLRQEGRPVEAVEFLLERSEALGLSELLAAAVLFRQESVPPQSPPAEARAWKIPEMNRGAWRTIPLAERALCLFELRTAPSNAAGVVGTLMEGITPRWGTPLTHALIRCSAHLQNGRKVEALAQLRLAVNELARGAGDPGWVPLYVDGRLCRTPRDWAEALNESLKAGLDLPPRKG